MKRSVLPIAYLLAGIALAGQAWAGEGMRAPVVVPGLRPPLQSAPRDFRASSAERDGPVSPLSLGLLAFYRHVISAVDGDRCSMAPTCSLYARQAIERYGALTGTLLTADRLLHEADEIPSVPAIQIGGETYYRDPLEANTYWWH